MSSISGRCLFVHDVWGLSEDMIMGGDSSDCEEEFPELFFGPNTTACGGLLAEPEPTDWRDTPGVLLEDQGQLEDIEYSLEYVLDSYFDSLLTELLDKRALAIARGLYIDCTGKHSGIFFFDDDPELDFSDVNDTLGAFNKKLPYLAQREFTQ